MGDELLVDVGVLRSLRGELSGLGTGMRANDPTTALAPVAAAMVSSEVGAACFAAGADLVRALGVLAGRVDTTSVAVGSAVTSYTAAEAAFQQQLHRPEGR